MESQSVEQFLELLLEGYSVAEAARTNGLSYKDGYKIAKENGWDRSLRDKDKCRNENFNQTIKSKISVKEMLELYDNGLAQVEIARIAGCSRQRIQQVVAANNRKGANQKKKERKRELAPFVELVKTLKKLIRAKEKQQRKDKRYEKDLERWKEARTLWARDISIEQISKRTGYPLGSLNWHLGMLRKEYGWFPRREPFGRHRIQKLTQEEKDRRLYEKYKSIIPLYHKKLTQQHIAAELGETRQWVGWGIYHLRKLGVDLPARKPK